MNKKPCQYCGNEISETAKFCKYCGSEQELVQNDALQEIGVKDKRSGKKFLLPTVACLLVVAIAASVFVILNPFKSGDEQVKNSEPEVENVASYRALAEATKETFLNNSFSCAVDLEFEADDEKGEFSADLKVITEDEDIKNLWADVKLDADKGQILFHDDKAYFYSNKRAVIYDLEIPEIPTDRFDEDYLEKFEECLDDFSWESFYKMLEDEGQLEKFEREFNTEMLEESVDNAIEILASKIDKRADKNRKIYSFNENLNALLDEIVNEFGDSIKDKSVLREIKRDLKNMPEIDVSFEIVVTDDYVSSVKFNIDSSEFELSFKFKIYDVGNTKITDAQIAEFTKKCEEAQIDYEDIYYYDRDVTAAI